MGQNKKAPSKAGAIKATANKASPAKQAVPKAPVKAAVHAKPQTKAQVPKSAQKATAAKPSATKKPTVDHKPAAKAAVKAPVAVAKAAPPKPAAKPHAAVAAKPAVAPTAKPNPAPVAAPVRQPVTAAAIVASRAQAAAAQTQRAMPASVAKVAGARITQPAMPKDLAVKAAAAHMAISAQGPKKPVSQRHGFKTNEWIVYPSHGVGRIVAIEEQEIAGMALELFVITFEKDKMTLRVPTGKSTSVGMRKLAEDGVVKRAMETLKGKARIKRTMWSRRAQEFESKINSGDLVAIAEVVRDLFRAENQPEQSYSERQLYEAALDRMSREIGAIEKLDDRGATQRITEVLSKSAKGRRLAAEEAAAAEVKAA